MTLRKRFYNEPWTFDFWQSLKLLQGKNFRFVSHVSQSFPASDVQSVTKGKKPRLVVNFLGLAGAHGPMPPPITDLIMERCRVGDTALRDFLDLFNHRLISLYCQAMEPMRPGVGPARDPAKTEFAEYLYAVTGLLTTGLKKPEHARLLPHAVLFASVRKTASGLEKIVSERFGVEAEVEEFRGRWLTIEETDRTKLGTANHRLGDTAMLGGRFWHQAAGITLRLKSLSQEQYRNFLPNGEKRNELEKVVRLYLGDDFECEIKLYGERDPPRLNVTRLGWG